MYRQRQLITVSDLDSWNECVAIFEEANKLAASKGWAQAKLFTRTIGKFNELCLEFEYPDLATFEREMREWMQEPGIGKLMRRMDGLRTEDSGYSEMWEEAVSVPAS
jgi:hypothetical protein